MLKSVRNILDFPIAYGDELEYCFLRKYCHAGFPTQHIILILYFSLAVVFLFCLLLVLIERISLLVFGEKSLFPLFFLFLLSVSLFSALHSGPFVFCDEAFLPSSYWGMSFDPGFVSTALRVFFLCPPHGLRAVISSCLWSSCFYLGPG